MLTYESKPFTTGRTRYLDGPSENDSKVFIEVKLGTLDAPLLAMVDTGAAFCILESEIAVELGLSFDPEDYIRLLTPRGSFKGTLRRTNILVIAQEGVSLDIEATVFVTEDWSHGNFLGYAGFLQRFRFAVDPYTNYFHFGPYGEW